MLLAMGPKPLGKAYFSIWGHGLPSPLWAGDCIAGLQPSLHGPADSSSVRVRGPQAHRGLGCAGSIALAYLLPRGIASFVRWPALQVWSLLLRTRWANLAWS